jgi:hypothetical protein
MFSSEKNIKTAWHVTLILNTESEAINRDADQNHKLAGWAEESRPLINNVLGVKRSDFYFLKAGNISKNFWKSRAVGSIQK